jgi:hypothetical protein
VGCRRNDDGRRHDPEAIEPAGRRRRRAAIKAAAGGQSPKPPEPRKIADPFGKLAAAEAAPRSRATIAELLAERQRQEQAAAENIVRGPGCSCPECVSEDRSARNPHWRMY